MDCARLKHDIDGLSVLKTQLEARLDAMNDTGKILAGDTKLPSQANEAQDQILEQYLDDFFEHNRDCFRCSDETVLRMDNKTINDIITMPDGSLAIASDNRLHLVRKQEDGSYAIKSETAGDVLGLLPRTSGINGLHLSSDNHLIAVRKDVIVSYDMTGEEIGNSKILMMPERSEKINSSAVLDNDDIAVIIEPEGKIMVHSGGETNEIARAPIPNRAKEPSDYSGTEISSIPNGFSVLAPARIELFDKQPDGMYKRRTCIESPDGEKFSKHVRLGNGDLFVMSQSGDAYICKTNEDDTSSSSLRRLGDVNDSYRGERTRYHQSAITPLPNGGVLVMASYAYARDTGQPPNALYKCEPTDDGEYQLSSPIAYAGPYNVGTMATSGDDILFNKLMMTSLYSLRPPTKNLQALKDAIENIAQKAPASEPEPSAL